MIRSLWIINYADSVTSQAKYSIFSLVDLKTEAYEREKLKVLGKNEHSIECPFKWLISYATASRRTYSVSSLLERKHTNWMIPT